MRLKRRSCDAPGDSGCGKWCNINTRVCRQHARLERARAGSVESSIAFSTSDDASATAAVGGVHNASRASEETHLPLRGVYGTRTASSAHDRTPSRPSTTARGISPRSAIFHAAPRDVRAVHPQEGAAIQLRPLRRPPHHRQTLVLQRVRGFRCVPRPRRPRTTRRPPPFPSPPRENSGARRPHALVARPGPDADPPSPLSSRPQTCARAATERPCRCASAGSRTPARTPPTTP